MSNPNNFDLELSLTEQIEALDYRTAAAIKALPKDHHDPALHVLAIQEARWHLDHLEARVRREAQLGNGQGLGVALPLSEATRAKIRASEHIENNSTEENPAEAEAALAAEHRKKKKETTKSTKCANDRCPNLVTADTKYCSKRCTNQVASRAYSERKRKEAKSTKKEKTTKTQQAGPASRQCAFRKCSNPIDRDSDYCSTNCYNKEYYHRQKEKGKGLGVKISRPRVKVVEDEEKPNRCCQAPGCNKPLSDDRHGSVLYCSRYCKDTAREGRRSDRDIKEILSEDPEPEPENDWSPADDLIDEEHLEIGREKEEEKLEDRDEGKVPALLRARDFRPSASASPVASSEDIEPEPLRAKDYDRNTGLKYRCDPTKGGCGRTFKSWAVLKPPFLCSDEQCIKKRRNFDQLSPAGSMKAYERMRKG